MAEWPVCSHTFNNLLDKNFYLSLVVTSEFVALTTRGLQRAMPISDKFKYHSELEFLTDLVSLPAFDGLQVFEV